MKVCPYCAKKIQDKMTICPYCGKSLTSSWLSRIKTHPKYKIGLFSGLAALIIIISGGGFIAYRMGFLPPRASCYQQSQVYLNGLTPLFTQWLNANQSIHELDKNEIELSKYALEVVRDEIAALSPPKCALKAHELLMSYMNETLDGYNAFLAGEPGSAAKNHIEQAAQDYNQYHTLVLELYPELSATSTPYP